MKSSDDQLKMARKQLFSSPVIRKIEIINSKKRMKMHCHGFHIVGGLQLTHDLGFRFKTVRFKMARVYRLWVSTSR